MTTTINIGHLQIFFDKVLNVDELLDRVVNRIQNIDLPSPGDLTPATTPLPATPLAPSAPVTTPLEALIAEVAQEQTPDPVTPIAPTEPAVTLGQLTDPMSVTIAQLDPAGNLELLQKPAPTLRSLPASAVAPAEKEALFYMRFPNASPQHRNGTRKAESEPEPTAPAPGTRKPEPPKAKPNALPFEEFDRLVRIEMKRLGSSGTMPGFGLWDAQRTRPLPSMGAVLQRYKVQTATELAAILGLNPPLGTQARTKIKADVDTDEE